MSDADNLSARDVDNRSARDAEDSSTQDRVHRGALGAHGRDANDSEHRRSRHGAVAELRREIIRRPVTLALIVILVAVGAYTTTKTLSSGSPGVAVAADQAAPETPAMVGSHIASSYRQYSLAHQLEPLAALYAADSVRYFGAGIITRDSILAELREDYRRLTSTDSLSVTIDSSRALGDTVIELTWRVTYERTRTDSTSFSGTTSEHVRLERPAGRWSIVEHTRRLIAGIAPDGQRSAARVASSARPKAISPAKSPSSRGSGSRLRAAPRRPVVDIGIEVNRNRDGDENAGKGKGQKAKKRRK